VTGVKFLALPNILAGEPIFREFVQNFQPADLSAALASAVEPPAADFVARVGPPGVIGRVADVVLGL
jgi:lipid A disaccharide synthetase